MKTRLTKCLSRISLPETEEDEVDSETDRESDTDSAFFQFFGNIALN